MPTLPTIRIPPQMGPFRPDLLLFSPRSGSMAILGAMKLQDGNKKALCSLLLQKAL
jgi:hypothetical protein